MWRLKRFKTTHPIQYESDEESSPPLLAPPASLLLQSSNDPLVEEAPTPSECNTTAVEEGFHLMEQFLSDSLSTNTKIEYQVCHCRYCKSPPLL